MVAAHALSALAPVLGLAAYCLSHLAACRLVRRRGNYFSLVIGCGCGLAVTAAINVAALLWMHCTLADGLTLAGINLVAYLALAFGYFNFVNLNIASLRIRMIQELAESGGRLAGRAPNRPLQHGDGHRSADRPPDPRRTPGRARRTVLLRQAAVPRRRPHLRFPPLGDPGPETPLSFRERGRG